MPFSFSIVEYEISLQWIKIRIQETKLLLAGFYGLVDLFKKQ